MLKTRNIYQILKQLTDPQKYKEPNQDVCEARHVPCTLGNEDLTHVFTGRDFLERDA